MEKRFISNPQHSDRLCDIPGIPFKSFCLMSLDSAFADDAHTAEEQVYDQHETKENFWLSELAGEDQQRSKRRTIYYESRYVTK
jgi:hypothetical protein